MTVVDGIVDIVGPRSVVAAMMNVMRRIVAKPNDVTAISGIVTERIVDLSHREVVVTLFLGLIAQLVAIDQSEKCGIGCITQDAPLIDSDDAAGCALAGSVNPIIEMTFCVSPVNRIIGQIREQHIRSVGL